MPQNVFDYKFINLFTGIDLTPKRLPLMSVDSGVAGPTVWLCAAIHGDEVTGTAVIHSIFRKIRRDGLLKGKIMAIPIMNPIGFEFISRHEPFDEEDLNRQFPGDKNGNTSERLAATIVDTILKTNPDYVIDLHTDSDNSIAYAILDYYGDLQNETTKRVIDLARVLRLPFALSTSETEDYDISESLSGYLVKRRVTALTLELGQPLFINPRFEKIGVSAICNLLTNLHMITSNDLFESAYYQILEGKLYKFTEKLKTNATGIVKFKVRPGEKVTRGQILGSVCNVFGKKMETIIAKRDGFLFSHDDQAITFPGQSLFTMVTPL
jgi:hypothetical protein